MTSTSLQKCQLCSGTELVPALFLGYIPPVNLMRPIGEPPRAEESYPAELLYCRGCHLVQLGYVVAPEILFPPEYPYTSGSTRILHQNFEQLAEEAGTMLQLGSKDLVVDIGSNDGTLLSKFQAKGQRVLGIEPTLTSELAVARGIPTVRAYFGPDVPGPVVKEHGRASVVTAANVFAHIDHPHAIVDSILELLAEDGVFISESHYLGAVVNGLQYDTIYHEHLRYYSLTSLQKLLNDHGLHVIHARSIPTHGGSIRVYATRNRKLTVQPSVAAILKEEHELGLDSDRWINGFRQRVAQSKVALYEVLAGIIAKGERVFGVGAPSRASTLINYVGLDDAIMSCVVEVSTSKKLNKYIPGTRIPVIDEAKLYAEQPEYALLLSWHIADELIANLARRGYRGDYIVPLPEPHIVRAPAVAQAGQSA